MPRISEKSGVFPTHLDAERRNLKKLAFGH
jgi:hypothetical protein